MEPSAVLVQRTCSPLTPYKAAVWEKALHEANIFFHFIVIPSGLHNGFLVDFPTVSHTQCPPNKESVHTYSDELSRIVHAEYSKGQYIGPFSKEQLTTLIGPFQTSPISIIPKPGHPGKFRLVQKFSYPLYPSLSFPNPSVNSYVNADNFPATWGKFSIIYLLTARLPPGSEAATRDVAEAYHTIPLHPSQWPAAVIRTSDDKFIVNSCLAFGSTPAAGVYGRLADAGTETFRSHGIGPLDKWVDDHIFFRIRKSHLEEYNLSCAVWAKQIADSGGLKQSGSHSWFAGHTSDNDCLEEFSENCQAMSLY